MKEETCFDNIDELLLKLPKGLTTIERVIISNEHTVQTLLSVILNRPVLVDILAQIENDEYIIRWVRLNANVKGNETVCLAESVIRKNSRYTGFINGIREKNRGIGQLLAAACIKTRRDILNYYSDDSIFSRTYKIKDISSDVSKELDIVITEIFYKHVFERLTNENKNYIT